MTRVRNGNARTNEKFTGIVGSSAGLGFQDRNSCAQMGRGVVEKFHHQRMPLERLLHDAALHAGAAAVNDSHLAQTRSVCLGDILLDHRGDIARRERMQIDSGFDWNAVGPAARDVERVLILHSIQPAGFSYRTVTSVLMPPRTEKSPTTVIRRG